MNNSTEALSSNLNLQYLRRDIFVTIHTYHFRTFLTDVIIHHHHPTGEDFESSPSCPDFPVHQLPCNVTLTLHQNSGMYHLSCTLTTGGTLSCILFWVVKEVCRATMYLLWTLYKQVDLILYFMVVEIGTLLVLDCCLYYIRTSVHYYSGLRYAT